MKLSKKLKDGFFTLKTAWQTRELLDRVISVSSEQQIIFNSVGYVCQRPRIHCWLNFSDEKCQCFEGECSRADNLV